MLGVKGGRYVNPINEDMALQIIYHLPTLDFEETLDFYDMWQQHGSDKDLALLGCNDRFFLVTRIMGRKDAEHPWLFERCREVEAEPDGYLDLWARFHYKSTFITFAGIIQEILIDPDLTVGIFAATKDIARPFLQQIKQELESNDHLKALYHDVLYLEPKKHSPSWSVDGGIVIKRESNPKESTVEAHGLIDALPTGRHFRLLVYDDLVNERLARNPEMIKKTTEQWELSSPLGVGEHTRRWTVGTRYSFADTYGVILDRKALKARLYPATENGKRDGKPVFMSQEGWDKIKVEMASQLSSQMLQNPTESEDATFKAAWFKPYYQRPMWLNVYITCDPSMGSKRKDSDNTAIAVIGVDEHYNKYLLDGARHRMNLMERWQRLRQMWQKWSEAPGIQSVEVGYERFGHQADMEAFEQQMEIEGISFEIKELSYPREGGYSKTDRIQRLQPDLEKGRFFIPAYVWHERGEVEADMVKKLRSKGKPVPAEMLIEWYFDKEAEQIKFKSVPSPTKLEQGLKRQGRPYLFAKKIERMAKDVNGTTFIYDLTRAFMEEARFHPFAPRDDLLDAMSRIYDMDAQPAVPFEADSLEQHDFPDA